MSYVAPRGFCPVYTEIEKLILFDLKLNHIKYENQIDLVKKVVVDTNEIIGNALGKEIELSGKKIDTLKTIFYSFGWQFGDKKTKLRWKSYSFLEEKDSEEKIGNHNLDTIIFDEFTIVSNKEEKEKMMKEKIEKAYWDIKKKYEGLKMPIEIKIIPINDPQIKVFEYAVINNHAPNFKSIQDFAETRSFPVSHCGF